MKGPIKNVLAEELENSLRMKKGYEAALKKLPQGCISLKKIKGHIYCYLVKREGKKVRYIYKGKLPEAEIKTYNEAKLLRAKYKKLLAKVNKQIKFLRSSLRGKEPI